MLTPGLLKTEILIRHFVQLWCRQHTDGNVEFLLFLCLDKQKVSLFDHQL